MAPAGFWGVCLGRCSGPGVGAGFEGRGEGGEERAAEDFEDHPPLRSLVFFPRHLGLGPNEQRYQRARKESPKGRGRLEKDEPLNS